MLSVEIGDLDPMLEEYVMKVLVVTNIYPTKEMPHWGSFVKSQMDSIATEGVDVDVMFIDSRNEKHAYFKAIWKMLRLKRGVYDLIHAHYGWAALVARFQLHTPLFVSFCGSDILGQPLPNGHRSLLSMVMSALAQVLNLTLHAAIVKSTEMHDKLIRREHIIVQPNGVDFELFRPMEREPLRKAFGMKPDTYYLLFAYDSHDPRKGFSLIKKAVQILNQKGISTEIFLFRGYPLEEMPRAINACDALVMASMWEGSPNLVKEAMACNLPIVSVHTGDVPDLIANCDGCAMADRNPHDIAEKLRPILLAHERTNGRDEIAHLDIRKVARQVIKHYKRQLK